MAETYDGLKKKYQELVEAHESIKSTLALYQQRCADLDVERQTYLASHASLVRSKQVGAPIVHRDIHFTGLLVAMAIQAVLVLGVLIAVIVK